MRPINTSRLVVALAIGLTLAAFTSVQSLSMIGSRTSPEIAAQIFPMNGEAREYAAFKRFEEAANDPAKLSEAAREVQPQMQQALRRDPTAPKALALLALAQDDRDAMRERVLLAGQINKRDITLQALILEAHLEREDFAQVILALDRILRVHRTYNRDFFPVLGEALRNEATIPVFAEILDGSSPWHEIFVKDYALVRDEMVVNLARLRMIKPLSDREFDQRLVARVARVGEIDQAAALIDAIGGDAERFSGTGEMSWSADFPPFDWSFINESDFRSQASRDGNRLELFARPGNGGLIAQRIVTLPGAPFTLSLSVDPRTAPSRADSLRVDLICLKQTQQQLYFSQALVAGDNRLTIADAPADCGASRLEIHARAWSGTATLRSELSRISVSQP